MFATPSAEQQRRRALRSARPGPLKDYLQTPFPDPATPVGDLRLLAVDLETTGLHPKKDRLLSIGFVPVDGLTIDLSGARRFVVQSGVEVGQSAAIHGLTDDTVAAGTPIEEALPEVLEALRGRAFNAQLEPAGVSAVAMGFDVSACRFVELCHELERPYLAPMFCESDSRFFAERSDLIELKRTRTQARDAAPCDFRFTLRS